MEEFKKRLLQEIERDENINENELSRLEKLSTFIKSEQFKGLNPKNQGMLIGQRVVMKTLVMAQKAKLEILYERRDLLV